MTVKIFFLKLASFSFFFILYLGINNFVNNYIFHNLKFPINSTKIIIAGDSHTRASLNPYRFDSATNISQSAEPYILTYWKLKYIFQHYQPYILILGFAHQNISAFNDMKFWNKRWSSEMFKRSYIIGEFGSLKNLKIDYHQYYKIYFRQMCLYPHTKHLNFIGGYSNNNTSDLSDVEEAIERQYYYRNEELGISETSILYLDHIIRLCNENNVVPVLIGSPVHKEYFRLIPSTIKKRYNYEKRRLKNKKVIVLDFTEDTYEDSFYLNADHLNKKGASQFTDKIVFLLKCMKAEENNL